MQGDEPAQKGELTACAADWLARLDCGTATLAELEAWKAQDPRHRLAFAEAAASWEMLNLLKRHPELGEGQAVARRETEHDSEAVQDEAHRLVVTRRRLVAGFAGALALGIAGAGGLRWSKRDSDNRIATATGEQRRLLLDDGSSIELNTASIADWRIDKAVHILLEQGELALSVASGGEKQHFLAADGQRFAMSAGRYVARLAGPQLRLVTLAGEARLLLPGGAAAHVILHAGEALTASGGKVSRAAISASEMEVATAWREGDIIFRGDTLSQAVREYNRYLTNKLILADPGIGDIQLGGRFHVDDPAEFIRSLRLLFGVRSRRTPQGIELFRGA